MTLLKCRLLRPITATAYLCDLNKDRHPLNLTLLGAILPGWNRLLLMIKRWVALFLWILAGTGLSHAATISFSGDLRTDAVFTACGTGCTLGPGNSDSDYAQWAAIEHSFSVNAPSAIQAITFSYGGGTNASGMRLRWFQAV